MSVIERIVAFCCRHALTITVLCALLGLGAAFYTHQNFQMNTNSEDLISPHVAWRMRQAKFDAEFPQQNNLIAIVIDGKTPELAESATARLAARLRENKALFPIVRRPDGGSFFNHNGLLFLPLKDVRETMAQLIEAQPFLGALAQDPSLRGIMGSLSTALLGVSNGQATLAQLDGPLTRFGDTFTALAQGKPAYLSWRALTTGQKPAPEELRHFIEVQPVLNYQALEPGAKASAAIRAAARDLGLTKANGVRVRLTGPVQLSDEEFGSLTNRLWLMLGMMTAGVLLTLWLATHSFRIIGAILATLAVGLTSTMAFGLLAVHVFNIISIAFIALFVGLGVDFGIQFSVRYRSERHFDADLARALARAGRGVGIPLALAAAATAAGFFSFLPTAYTGVAELGLIAGAGMIIAFVLSITMLPALLMLLKPGAERVDVGFRFLAPVDRFIAEQRRFVLTVTILLALGAAVLVYFVRFDANPLDLRDPHTESVATIFDLMKNPNTSPNTIDVPTPSLAAADDTAQRIDRLPLVDHTLTLSSFVPDEQSKKLALIADANMVLGTTLDPFTVKPPPSDSEVIASFLATAQKLRAAAGDSASGPARHARRLAGALESLARGDIHDRKRAETALVPGLKTMLAQLSASLQATPVTLKNLPPDMIRAWIAPDGTARIQVFPKNTTGNSAALAAFSKSVLKVAPNATGPPISIRESGTTILRAFAQAGILSFIAIAILLTITLRRLRDVVMTLLPLLLTGLLTLASCVVVGMPLNFANVIALPLLLGIGVAFNIYFVVAWRAGQKNLLQSSLTRAVIFSAATTASGFGTLWISNHPGTASMGELLMISLGWTLITTLFLSPALLGEPPPYHERTQNPVL
jgi:hopanoid biosynthesis associated RND transporter like protein HpnN